MKRRNNKRGEVSAVAVAIIGTYEANFSKFLQDTGLHHASFVDESHDDYTVKIEVGTGDTVMNPCMTIWLRRK